MGNFAKITSGEEIKFLDIAAGGTMLAGIKNCPSVFILLVIF